MVQTAEPDTSIRQGPRVERGVPVPMRDGTILRADVYRPRAPGRYPVIVERTLYELIARATDGDYFAARGYVLVAQNVRGAFDSEGTFRFGEDDGWSLNRDGY